ncbi:hypothetical protein [Actinomyces trachealis]|uniref:hypothetical protein n=1 Tax=Actinomyces trachealis TaxID=2763540 RepID=UPI0018929666|nr:hypothetical protein [Actinomyces trachealis]
MGAVDGRGLPHLTRLSDAHDQLVNYLDTVDATTGHTGWDITLTPDVAGVHVADMSTAWR